VQRTLTRSHNKRESRKNADGLDQHRRGCASGSRTLAGQHPSTAIGGLHIYPEAVRTLPIRHLRNSPHAHEGHLHDGPRAAEIFYEPGRFTRKGALPQTTLRLLQDRGSA
jgi:hypothetical protein